MNLNSPLALDSDLRYRVIFKDSVYRWLDRKTKEFLTHKDGKDAPFDSLDEAISAFVNGTLTVSQNEHLTT